MRAVEPALVGVLVALQAVVVHHQRLRRNEVAARGFRSAGLEVFLAVLRLRGAERRVRRMEEQHHERRRGGGEAELDADAPLDLRPGEPVQDVEPDCEQRRDHVRPIGDVPRVGILEAEILEAEDVGAGQCKSGHQHDDTHDEQRIADAHRATIGPVVRVLHVDQPKEQIGHDQHQPEDQVGEEHELIEIVLIQLRAVDPFEKRDRREVERVGAKQRDERENEVEQVAQLRTDRAHVFLPRCAHRVSWAVFVHRIAFGLAVFVRAVKWELGSETKPARFLTEEASRFVIPKPCPPMRGGQGHIASSRPW